MSFGEHPPEIDAVRHGPDALGVIADARARVGETLELAARHLDPSLVDLLGILGFDQRYVSGHGSYLYDVDDNAFLDFHTGEGFASLGHNHPGVREVLQAALAEDMVDGVQIHYSVLAGMLAEELTKRLPDGLDAVFFSSAGAEAVDAAIKFARAATRRKRLISCDSSFHGVTLGPLSLVGDDFFKERFGPLLPGCKRVPFGDLKRLEAELRKRDVAAFIVEPIQGREVTLPPEEYLLGAQRLCRRYGTLFVVDEIQTGLGRTGRWFALEHYGLEPDMVTVGKTLSGGYMPVAATVLRRELYQRAVGTLERAYVHQSTYGRNRLSMAAGLAAIRIIERDGLIARSEQLGALLMDGLRELAGRYEMLGEIRGKGLMIGIELQAPRARWAKLNWHLIHMASGGLFPQLLVIPLHRDHHIITMAAGKNDVIKLLPPLTLSEDEVAAFLDAFDAVLADCHDGAGKNWRLVRDIAVATLRRRADGRVRRGAGRRGGVGAQEDSGAGGHAGTNSGAEAAHVRRGTPVDPALGDICLVTGATGFIGSHVVRRLVADGYQVRCLVRPTSDTASLDGLGVEIVTGDLTDAGSLARAVDGCRYVAHCAALVSDWATVDEITAANVVGTRNLLQACVGASVRRVVHVSTTDVYGHPGALGVDEGRIASGFANHYSQTKAQAEAEIWLAQGRHELEAVILRPATVYGPGSFGLVGEIASALRSGTMLLVGGGRPAAGLCYVANLVDAVALSLTMPGVSGEAFNITDGVDVSWKQFTTDLADGLGCRAARWSLPYRLASGLGTTLECGYRAARRTTGLSLRPLLSRQSVQVLGVDQSFSNRKAREVLGWEPRVGYQEGLAETLRWLAPTRTGQSRLGSDNRDGSH